MADTVTTKTMYSGNKRHIASYSNISDGTGESGVTKLDISTLTNPVGATVTEVKIYKIQYSISPTMSVKIYFDHTADVIVGVFTGSGVKDYSNTGGFIDAGTGGTGDVLFTTAGQAANDTYDITIEYGLK
jgi:hypothetical protein